MGETGGLEVQVQNRGNIEKNVIDEKKKVRTKNLEFKNLRGKFRERQKKR